MKFGEVEVALTSKRAGDVIWGLGGDTRTKGIKATMVERRRLRETILSHVINLEQKRGEREGSRRKRDRKESR